MNRALVTVVTVVAAIAAVAPAAAICSCGVEGTVLRGLPSGASEDAGDAGPTDSSPPPFFDDGAPRGDAAGVFAGQGFTCALAQGLGSCWGDNQEGDLGAGDQQNRLVPTPIVGGIGFSVLAAGEFHTCGLQNETGQPLCWGGGANGQLGLGDRNSWSTPRIVPLGGPAAQLAVGYDHSCIVGRDSSLWCWGANAEGQIGLDDEYGAPDVLSPARVGTANDWLAVSGGQGHTCGIRAPGTMWCWGRNSTSELGLGDGQSVQLRAPTQVGTFDDWTAVDLGQDNACGLRSDGSLWCWGDGSFGQLADPPGVFSSPTQVGADTDWKVVSTDEFATCALKTSGALYCWGRNAEGQLGLGDTNDRMDPTATGGGARFGWVSVGRFHACAETTGLAVLCTGDNGSGQLGQNDTMRRDLFTPVALPTTP
jgi:alpha-tubulin suppressor-like RCC1 family protein